jgi:hypothetical protein
MNGIVSYTNAVESAIWVSANQMNKLFCYFHLSTGGKKDRGGEGLIEKMWASHTLVPMT